eukprot:scaffold1585_cov81-Skeletonema_dohrnii-CCMP3373.AAC.1
MCTSSPDRPVNRPYPSTLHELRLGLERMLGNDSRGTRDHQISKSECPSRPGGQQCINKERLYRAVCCCRQPNSSFYDGLSMLQQTCLPSYCCLVNERLFHTAMHYDYELCTTKFVRRSRSAGNLLLANQENNRVDLPRSSLVLKESFGTIAWMLCRLPDTGKKVACEPGTTFANDRAWYSKCLWYDRDLWQLVCAGGDLEGRVRRGISIKGPSRSGTFY